MTVVGFCQAAVVREAALDALLALYNNVDNRTTMHEFTQRFQHRFLELPNDVDDNVAIKGVSFAPIVISMSVFIMELITGCWPQCEQHSCF